MLATVATEVALLLQVPPDVAFDKANVLPAHTVDDPVMVPASSTALTVTTLVATSVPHATDTV